MAATKDLTKGDIKKTIIQLTLPMILGMLGMVAFNFADTAFIGQLGGAQLAALSFTFPVVMIVQSVAHGLGIGTASVIARVASKRDSVKRLATDGLILSFIVVLIVVIAGMLTIKPLFYSMGATDTEMPYILQYMTVWYIGVPMVVIPMVGNNIIRALGDTKVPGLVMLLAACVNIVLDPLLIFGIWFFPEMGVVGGALATVISRFISLCVTFYLLGVREKLLTLKGISFAKIGNSFKRILHVGIPSTLTKGIVPFGTYIVTGLLAVYGSSVVAGYGAGVKTEFVGLCVVNAIGAVMISFAGQNYGVRNIERVRQGFKYACLLNFVYSIGIYIILFFTAPYIAMIFSAEQMIRQTTVLYIRIAVAGLAFQGGIQIITSAYNAVGKPLQAAFISLLQMFVIYIPLSYLLSSFMGKAGIFLALVVSYVIAAVVGYVSFMRFLRKESAANEIMLSESKID